MIRLFRRLLTMKYFSVIIFFINILFSDGPYTVDTITEQDGLRNGPEYSGALKISRDITSPGPSK